MKKYVSIFLLVSIASVGLQFADPKQNAAAKFYVMEVAEIGNSTALATEFVDLLAKENFVGAVQNFDSAMKAQLPPEKLQAAWRSLTAKVGQFKKQAGLRTEKLQQYDVVFVTCQFEKVTLDIRVVYNSAKQIAGLSFRPKQNVVEYQLPAYAKLAAFQEKAVEIGTGASALPGTLTLPAGNGPFPAIVLVHGSGANDRDESFGPNKPFRDLASGLASRGIAVLRYDKRTKVYPKIGLQPNFTVKEEVIDDAIAAVSLLRKTQRIDTKKIFVLGHSLGGMLIPRIAKLDPNIAGLIVMAGNSRPFEDLFLDQTAYLISLVSDISAEEKKVLESIRQQVAKIKSPQLNSAPATESLLGAPPSYWLDLRGYNPIAVARQLDRPMLILQGERDYQVTTVDFKGWQKALSERANVTFKTYPKLNHLFLEGEGKSTPDEYQKPGHVPEVVIKDIANWIERQ